MEPKITFLQLKEYMRDVISDKHKATKCNYLIEPQKNSFYEWEDFNTSNPTLMRVQGKTLLGYRAGGTDTCYVISPNGDISWGSELGIAILDDKGENVTQRFPLPIFRSQRRIDFPKTISQYKEVVDATPDEDIAYHDFRLINLDAYVYIYYHNGKIADFLDFIVKMPEDIFLSKIKDCEKLIAKNQVTTEEWFSIWADSEWENAGIDGNRNFYGGRLPKNNISIYKLKNGDIHCTHRPAPDNAILNIGKNTSVDTTEDGIPKLGTLETCVRADCFDNSHLGSNGTETLATILGQEVLICVTHGVHNLAFSNSPRPARNLCYLPFFRVKDYETGEVLHWSREPIMLIDDQWSEYTFYGNWVASLDEFCYTSFPGGQLPEIEGKNAEDDLFYCPIGIGDTATGRLSFKPKDLLSQSVMENIRDYKYFNQKKKELDVPANTYHFKEPISGWTFSIENIANQMSIIGHVQTELIDETHQRPVHKDAQSFDFSMSLFDGRSIFYSDELGYVALIQGVTFAKENGKDVSRIGYGVILMHKEDPNRILFRSFKSVTPIETLDGITYDKHFKQFTHEEILSFIPANVKTIKETMTKFEPSGYTYPSTHTRWLRDKAAGKSSFDVIEFP